MRVVRLLFFAFAIAQLRAKVGLVLRNEQQHSSHAYVSINKMRELKINLNGHLMRQRVALNFYSHFVVVQHSHDNRLFLSIAKLLNRIIEYE